MKITITTTNGYKTTATAESVAHAQELAADFARFWNASGAKVKVGRNVYHV